MSSQPQLFNIRYLVLTVKNLNKNTGIFEDGLNFIVGVLYSLHEEWKLNNYTFEENV